jgi:hypothetical protein
LRSLPPIEQSLIDRARRNGGWVVLEAQDERAAAASLANKGYGFAHARVGGHEPFFRLRPPTEFERAVVAELSRIGAAFSASRRRTRGRA